VNEFQKNEEKNDNIADLQTADGTHESKYNNIKD
jgi:hypothetical protein